MGYLHGFFDYKCDRGGIQTRNPHIRSVVLYSVELRSHCFSLSECKDKAII